MKILFLTSRLPWPLDKGDKLRAFHQIRHLAQEHDVYLFSLVDSKPTEEALAALTPFVREVHTETLGNVRRWVRMAGAVFSSRPFQVHWFFQRSAMRALQQWERSVQPDVIYCQLIRMAEYVKGHHATPRVLDYMDALSAGIARQSNLAPPYLRWVYRLEYRRLRAYESAVFDYFDGQTIISEADRKLIAHPEQDRIRVIPNGIDTAHFQPVPGSIEKSRLPPTLLFTGNMSYPPNVDAAVQLVEQVLPKLKTPNVHLIIAGTEPDAQVQRLATDRVRITGWIPDIREAYQAADVFVAPLRIGTGQQNKILEAMSMELPCVTTPHVRSGFPINGSDAPPMRIGESAEQLAIQIDSLLSHPEERGNLGRLSRVWVEKHCNWSQTVAELAHTFVNSTYDQPEETLWNNTI